MNENLYQALVEQIESEEVSLQRLLWSAFCSCYDVDRLREESFEDFADGIRFDGQSEDLVSLNVASLANEFRASEELKSLGIPLDAEAWDLEDYIKAEGIVPKTYFKNERNAQLSTEAYEAWKQLSQTYGIEAPLSHDKFAALLKSIKRLSTPIRGRLVSDYIEWAVGNVIDDLGGAGDSSQVTEAKLKQHLNDCVNHLMQ